MLDLLNLPMLLGGLGLFIYAIGEMSSTLQAAFTDRARDWVQQYTRHLLVAVLIGTLVTVLLDSSSATIILTIVFVNAGALDFRRAAGLVLGANIGTTFSSQLIALNIAEYCFIPIVLGTALSFVRREGVRKAGQGLLYFGFLFFGLLLMEQSVEPLKDSPEFETWIEQLEKPVTGALVGGLITLIVQSSSATVGMAIVLGKQGLISVAAGLALMLGAELGTCSDTLLATIGGKRGGVKTGIFHLAFNLFTIGLGLLLFQPFVGAVAYLSGGQEIDNHIANGHMLFNIAGVLLVLPLVPPIVRLIDALLPDGEATPPQAAPAP